MYYSVFFSDIEAFGSASVYTTWCDVIYYALVASSFRLPSAAVWYVNKLHTKGRWVKGGFVWTPLQLSVTGRGLLVCTQRTRHFSVMSYCILYVYLVQRKFVKIVTCYVVKLVVKGSRFDCRLFNFHVRTSHKVRLSLIRSWMSGPGCRDSLQLVSGAFDVVTAAWVRT